MREMRRYPSRRVIVDTTAYFALTDPDDEHHSRAVTIIDELLRRRAQLITTIFVVAEVHGLVLNRINRLMAAKLLGEIGDPRRFASHDAFAAFAGVAPIPASSGQVQRMRLNRGGNRQINRALFTAAFVQSQRHPAAMAFMARKRAEGKSWREALRCLKRHLARRVYRLLEAPSSAISVAA